MRAATGLALAAACTLAGVAGAADLNTDALYAPSAWDLHLGAHASELAQDQFIGYACGTNGGPPGQPIAGWTAYAQCAAERDTGFHEIQFKYDNEPEYWAKAHDFVTQTKVFQYTSAYEIPIIVSGLFDDGGFLVGVRMVSDPRVPTALRENALALGRFLMARYGDPDWTCTDLPQTAGEQPYQGIYEKRQCRKAVTDEHLNVAIETHYFRKAGQLAIDPNTNLPTEGQFESSTRFEMLLAGDVPDRAARLAAITAQGAAAPTPKDALIQRALNCPGCDLQGVDLKRANLTGANLAGANLAGANLHEATLAGANLSGANLAGANINHADLKRANLTKANLKQAMLYESRLDGADLSGADLTQGMAGKVQFIGATLVGARMIAMDLRDGRMNDANFSGADLAGSWIHGATLTRSNMTNAVLAKALLWQTNLVQVNLTGANCQGADLIRANLREADLTNTDFSYARLTFANLADAVTDGTIWEEAELPAGFPN